MHVVLDGIMTQAAGPTAYRRTACELADAHRKADPETKLVMLDPDPKELEIRLVEVSASAPTTNELYPFAFGPRKDLGIDYPSVVLLLSPKEWDDVNAGSLALPAGWDRTRLQNI